MGTRIQFHNLILIVTVLIVTTFAFHALSERYLLNEAKMQMKSDAEAIALSLKSSQVLSDRIVAERIVNSAKLKIIGRAIDSYILIVDKNNRLLYTNAKKSDVQIMRNWNKQNTDGYLVQRRDIRSENGQLSGKIILAIQIKDVKGLNRVLRGAQWASTLIGGAIAVIMGVLLSRTITKPIRRLAVVMRNFSPREQLPLPDMKSRGWPNRSRRWRMPCRRMTGCRRSSFRMPPMS
jgi:methyl-accepting chemotaxis protein